MVISSFLKKKHLYPSCLKNFEKILKTVISRKLQGFVYSYMEASIAKPGKTLTTSNYWVANYKLDEIKTEFKRENRKKTLTIAIYDIA